ncbi:cytochrome P450 [Daldinia sp. FL1419]|nr:cytochrome P450 [Daldinia sp. FL1419]
MVFQDIIVSYSISVATLFIILLCSAAVYRVLFHPLRELPGPLIARISDVYGAYFAVRKDLHLVTLKDHNKYGLVLRQGPNKVIFNSVSAFKAIHQNDRITKSRLYLCGNPSIKNKNTFLAIDRDIHRSKRKTIGQSISERSMRRFEPIMIKEIDTFLTKLLESNRSSEPKPLNMTEHCKYLGLDIAGLLSFGYNFHLQGNEKNRFLIHSINYTSWLSNILLQWPVLYWFRLDLILSIIFYKVQISTYKLVISMIKERMALEKNAKEDLYSFVADTLMSGPGKMDEEYLLNEATFLLQAGGDTTATCISATFFYLSRNQECYNRIANEIRSAFNSGNDIRGGPILAKCHYLRACIDESLRMSPPAAGTLWREQYPDDQTPGPLIIDGHVIPKGTHIGINIYALHHNEEYFPDSFNYQPERWITPSGSPISHDAFAAFLAGPRGCAGKAMAYLEASLVLAKTLWYFDFGVAPGKLGTVGMGEKGNRNGRDKETEFQLYDTFTASSDGPYLVFHPRGDYWKELGNKQ